jgi:uncharacterized protein YlxW (UPF0749 family)
MVTGIYIALAIGITVYVMMKINGSVIAGLKVKKQSLENELDQIKKDNFKLEQELFRRETRINDAKEKIEKVKNDSLPDNVSELSNLLNSEY